MHDAILIVDQDPSAREACRQSVCSLRLDAVCVPDGHEALAMAHRARFSLLLVELRLPGLSGLDLVRVLRAGGFRAPFVVVSGCATVRTAVEAMALGAVTVLEKPVPADQLQRVVEHALGPATPPEPPVSHTALERWCGFVMKLIASEQDLKTNAAWARHVGVSRSVLCETCRLVHVVPHDARDFARMLRAISGCGREWMPETVLDVADVRTLNRLEARAHLKRHRHGRTPTIEEFLEAQQWIPADHAALHAMRRLLGTGEPCVDVTRETSTATADPPFSSH